MQIPYAIARYSIGQKKLPDGTIIYAAIDSELSKTFGWQVKWLGKMVLDLDLQMDKRGITTICSHRDSVNIEFPNNASFSKAPKGRTLPT